MTKTYDTYKDSGIAWIGEIPSDWTLVDAKRILKNEKKLAGVEADNYERLALTLNGVIKRSKDDSEGLQPEKFESYQILGKNELVFKLIDLQNISTSRVGISPYEGLVSPAYIVVKNRKSEDNKYYYYWYMNMYFTHVFNNLGGDGVRSAINAQDLLSLKIPYISVEEQKSIASFLDKKCGEIDSLISLQEEMITELQAYKQSLITETVTKGLDPNAPMKDSGEEWLGEIPSDWELLPIRALFTKRNKKNDPIISKERLSLSIGIGITRYADKTTNLDRFKEDFTAYQLAYPDDIVLNSMNMIVGAVGKSAFTGCVSPVYYVITAKEGVDPNFYAYLLNSPKIREVYHSLGRGIYAIERGEGRVNTCRLKVPYYDFSIIKVPVPSYEEQIKIATYLDEKTQQIDSLIALKQDKIAELKDYKKSVIYEYVTGKKRV